MDKLIFDIYMKNLLTFIYFFPYLLTYVSASSASFKIEDDDNLTKKDQTNNTTAKQDLIDFDSWSSDMLNKPQDKTSIVKQGVQTLQLVSCLSENIF